MLDTVAAIVVAYGIIVGLEYLIKDLLAQRQSPLSPETRRVIEQKLLEQYEDGHVVAYGRGLPKRRGIGF